MREVRYTHTQVYTYGKQVDKCVIDAPNTILISSEYLKIKRDRLLIKSTYLGQPTQTEIQTGIQTSTQTQTQTENQTETACSRMPLYVNEFDAKLIPEFIAF